MRPCRETQPEWFYKTDQVCVRIVRPDRGGDIVQIARTRPPLLNMRTHVYRTDLIRLEHAPTLTGPLYHFTAVENVASILKYGLLSQQQLRLRNVSVNHSSNSFSRQTDKSYGLHRFVHLCRQPEHPMTKAAVHRGIQVVWLEIHPPATPWRGRVLYTNTNALAKEVVCTHSPSTAWDSSDVQAEILVQDIPAEYIRLSGAVR